MLQTCSVDARLVCWSRNRPTMEGRGTIIFTASEHILLFLSGGEGRGRKLEHPSVGIHNQGCPRNTGTEFRRKFLLPYFQTSVGISNKFHGITNREVWRNLRYSAEFHVRIPEFPWFSIVLMSVQSDFYLLLLISYKSYCIIMTQVRWYRRWNTTS
jgi:hypothetical protein